MTLFLTVCNFPFIRGVPYRPSVSSSKVEISAVYGRKFVYAWL